MIKFFRKIRQRLVTENKFSKYLIYSIGEIVLLVIGILIALQINNWNNKSIAQDRLWVYLEQIKKDISIDIKNLNALSLNLKETQRSSSICYGYFLDKNIPNPSLFMETFWSIAYNFDFSPRLQGIEGLRNSGSIENMNNNLSEDLLYQYYSLIDEISVVETEFNSFINNFENQLALNGFLIKFGGQVTEELLEQITYENVTPYAGIDIIFGRTANGTGAMQTGYEQLEDIGEKILKSINEIKKNEG